MSFNMFNGNTFMGARMCSFDRASMLSGNNATQQCFQTSNSYGGVLPSDFDGSTLPPSGSPNYFVSFDTNSLDVWKFHVDWTIPANSTLTGPSTVATAPFSVPCNGGGTCIPQRLRRITQRWSTMPPRATPTPTRPPTAPTTTLSSGWKNTAPCRSCNRNVFRSWPASSGLVR
jgi:hypothetical protein